MNLTIPDLNSIDRIKFFKRDEITTDLIFCEITSGTDCYFFHEEMDGWNKVISDFECLSAFDKGWFGHVSLPPFREAKFVAYAKANQ